MELVSKALKYSPSTWDEFDIKDYKSKHYFLIDLPASTYEDVVSDYSSDDIAKIQRVQHAAQLSLYILSMGNREQLGEGCYEKTGYHVVHQNDLETALRYPLDYRRYRYYCHLSATGDQPMFHEELMAAITHAKSTARNAIIKCEILSYSSYQISTKYQWDYLPLYVIFLE